MTTTYGVGNPNPSLEHARQKSGRFRPVNGIGIMSF